MTAKNCAILDTQTSNSGDTPAKQPWQTPLLIAQELNVTENAMGHHYDGVVTSFSNSDTSATNAS